MIRLPVSTSLLPAVMTANGRFPLVIMLGFDHFGNRIKDLQNRISTFSQNMIAAADMYPCDYLLFYIQESLKTIAERSRPYSFLNPEIERRHRPSTYDWESNQGQYRNLLRSQGTMSRYLQRNYSLDHANWPILASTLQDYEVLITETKENATQLQGLLQNYTSIQAIKESQKGFEQADAVRRYSHFY